MVNVSNVDWPGCGIVISLGLDLILILSLILVLALGLILILNCGLVQSLVKSLVNVRFFLLLGICSISVVRGHF